MLDLVADAGAVLPSFEAGAHVDIHLGPGLIRQYSLCGDPSDRSRYRLGILLNNASRGGSAALHRSVHAGDRLRIGLPRNHFPFTAAAQRSILIGGGIGITPLLAMARHCIREGKPFLLHYCARSRDRAAFLEELAEEPLSTKTHLHFDDGEAAQRFDPDRDLPRPSSGTHLYVCGPSGFMDWAIVKARGLGYHEEQIHREYFEAEVDMSGDGFEVTLAKSGLTVAVPAGVSIVKALADAGVTINVSCEQGVCGTCTCNVIEGIPDHRDSYLNDDEKAANDQILPCCSRSHTPVLVLDL
ncbi:MULTISPECIES: PDR/VanB family oxidoreductase [unclassified Bradyrhizobium]|uniref:PDR/VanB family oxidoreductase n=1 Tax=unclassified Bradyrhizobium TaxID=2631580 RepID=UPI0024492D8E|nr:MULTISPECIES: PDR/VanB family oxidoreductase [unclassified Bradyrhizobium]MDH2346143.1 PDR/VanB family oxidoreductase [Bradyrhizobium sp. SSUT77]MDH2350483.1 PDR/VanB family oxidoreductase [Bradyrhizobium sp. SSUT112]